MLLQSSGCSITAHRYRQHAIAFLVFFFFLAALLQQSQSAGYVNNRFNTPENSRPERTYSQSPLFYHTCC